MHRVTRHVPGLAFAALLACSGSKAATPSRPGAGGWWTDRVVYEVFVRSFADSDGNGTGDLAGLTSHLDDLNDADPLTTTDLGIGALWLMPIFPSPSYHGYDVIDYRSVKGEYGTLADVDALVTAAHARGIKVVLDFVPNHTSTAHPWFVDARSGAGATHRDWYVWRASDPGWTQLTSSAPTWHADGGSFYYGYFWGGMPDLNLRNAAVEAELLGAMRFWLARGIDGFRLDAVRHLVEGGAGVLQVDQPESHELLRRMRAALAVDYPDVLLVGEAWTGLETVAEYWGSGDELHLAFSFDLAEALVQGAKDGDASPVINVVARTERALAGKDRRFEAPFLSNHDQTRVMRAVAGDPGAARVAAATLLALPGTPFIYYGEELGMQGGPKSSGDEFLRTPYRWTATGPGYGFTTGTPWMTQAEAAGVDLASQRADAGSLWNLYRRVIAVRRGAPGLSSAEAVRARVEGGGAGVLALLRGGTGQRVLYVANFATAPTGAFTVTADGAPAVLDAEGLGTAPTASGGVLSFPGLAPRAWAFFSLR